MTTRTATCRCGRFSATCTGEPTRISVCHCLDCQKRSGSSFAAQARWPNAAVEYAGAFNEWSTTGENGKATFRFCPNCGSTVAYSTEGMPDLTAVAIGAFADPAFPQPEYSTWEERKHAWVEVVGDGVEHYE
jgi:hypothetical protein